MGLNTSTKLDRHAGVAVLLNQYPFRPGFVAIGRFSTLLRAFQRLKFIICAVVLVCLFRGFDLDGLI